MNKIQATEQKQLFIPKHFGKVLLFLIIFLAICVIASLLFGSRTIGWTGLMDGLFHPDVESHEAVVIRKRIVRTIFSLLCGAALGVSGALMQAVTRNPIADPSILGVNTGASLLSFVVLLF